MAYRKGRATSRKGTTRRPARTTARRGVARRTSRRASAPRDIRIVIEQPVTNPVARPELGTVAESTRKARF
nr:MAG: hypothetical protein [Microvirus sp.]